MHSSQCLNTKVITKPKKLDSKIATNSALCCSISLRFALPLWPQPKSVSQFRRANHPLDATEEHRGLVLGDFQSSIHVEVYEVNPSMFSMFFFEDSHFGWCDLGVFQSSMFVSKSMQRRMLCCSGALPFSANLCRMPSPRRCGGAKHVLIEVLTVDDKLFILFTLRMLQFLQWNRLNWHE